ncbi:MAG: hypothetical protein ACXVEF_11970 [Polyangiales bacterium]
MLTLATLACGGSQLERELAKPKAKPASTSAAAAASSSNETEGPAPDVDKITRWTWTTIGCQVGAAWSEALGALGEERVLSTLRRCRTVTSEILGTKIEDEAALRNVRDVDAATLDRIIAKLEKSGGGELAPLVRASAEASREALFARRAAESVRKGADLASAEKALSAKEALAKLWARKEKEAKTIALILAADHVEATRGLEGPAKVAVASPAFEVVFGVPKQSDWSSYLVAASKAAGHPADDEKSALTGIVAAFAERFEQQGKALGPGEANDVSWGYARRLRKELKDQQAAASKK